MSAWLRSDARSARGTSERSPSVNAPNNWAMRRRCVVPTANRQGRLRGCNIRSRSRPMAELTPRDFAGMSAEEEVVYVAVESSPGIPARDLGKALHHNTAAVLKVVQRLVDRGFVERRA